MILWNGSCIVHEAFSFEKILKLFKEYPNAKFIAHPESEPHILEIANFIGSTSALLKYVNESIGSNPGFGKGHGPINHLNSITII